MIASGTKAEGAERGTPAPPLRRAPSPRMPAALATLAVHILAAATLLPARAGAPQPSAPGPTPSLTIVALPQPQPPRAVAEQAHAAIRPPHQRPLPAPSRTPTAATAEARAAPQPLRFSLPFPVPGAAAAPARATPPFPAPSPPRAALSAASATSTASAASAAAPEKPASPAAPDETADAALRAYAARLQAHIAARRPVGLPLAGTSLVAFRVDRQGNVATLRLARSSGSALLDALALRLVKKAAPLPEPPATLTDRQLDFRMPVAFR